MTPELLTELERLEKEATPGPWLTSGCNQDPCWCRTITLVEGSDHNDDCVLPSGSMCKAEVELIVALRNHAKALIREAKAANEYLAALEKCVDKINDCASYWRSDYVLECELRPKTREAMRHINYDDLVDVVMGLASSINEYHKEAVRAVAAEEESKV